MINHDFIGPLFIIGMPRSGTKLLRDLLNQNPNIGIPTTETHFIPTMINRFGNPPNFNLDTEFNRFFKSLKNTTFWKINSAQYSEMTKGYLKKHADIKSWNSIFEVILKYYAPSGRAENFIWGDKSPSYTNNSLLMKEIFPNSKFIHIIRDPRDCCLSAKKTWGKNIYRTAEIWRQWLINARTNGLRSEHNYLEVLYEDLISTPEDTMRSICDFIPCKFTRKMIELKKPSENLGDTKGQSIIVKENMKKYVKELMPKEIKRIEEIVYPVMKQFPYQFEFNVTYKPVNKLILFPLTIYDGITMIKFNIRDKGILKGMIHYYQLLSDSNALAMLKSQIWNS
jgi:hypothetical protein